MEKNSWINDLHTTDSLKPSEEVKGETMYTLYQKDFLQMPPVQFSDLADLDPDIRALLN
jgi:hypothetical protein